MVQTRRVSEAGFDAPRKVLAFAALVEIGTGLALMIVPATVVALLLGASEPGEETPLGRFLGIALIALGTACWPGGLHVEGGAPSFRATLIYNALVALYLAWLGAVAHRAGPLLWPAVALHAVVALLLVRAWRAQPPAPITNT